MGIHGVDESEYVKFSNMKFLHEQVKKSDRILNF